MTIVAKGTSYRKIKSPMDRVHLAAWHPGTKGWEPVCQRLFNTAKIGHNWAPVKDREPLTCPKCIKHAARIGATK
jgi:hypothetical protein